MAAVKKRPSNWEEFLASMVEVSICMSAEGIFNLTYDSGIVQGRPKVILRELRSSRLIYIHHYYRVVSHRSRSIQPNQVRLRISHSKEENPWFACGECNPSWYATEMAKPCVVHAWTDFWVPWRYWPRISRYCTLWLNVRTSTLAVKLAIVGFPRTHLQACIASRFSVAKAIGPLVVDVGLLYADFRRDIILRRQTRWDSEYDVEQAEPGPANSFGIFSLHLTICLTEWAFVDEWQKLPRFLEKLLDQIPSAFLRWQCIHVHSSWNKGG